MTQIIRIILTIIAPIILVAGLGVLLDRTKTLETRSISRLVIYLASPALVFYTLANTSLKGDELAGLFFFPLLVSLAMAALAWPITLLFKMDRLTAGAFALAVAMVNIGNYGIPFNEFAFGQPGLERALVTAVGQSLTAYTLGVFLASWGRASVWRALGNVFKVPTPYAAVLGLTVNFAHVPVPDLIMRVAGILQGAAVPLMLTLLGVQISRVSLNGGRWGLIFSVAGMRLIGGALVGVLIATLLGLQGLTWKVAAIQAAMPTAVVTTLLATEYEGDAGIASCAVLVSTLGSVLTLSVWLYLLR